MSPVCSCGMDHAVERKAGAQRSYHNRVERWGEPFKVIAEGALYDPIELRVNQTEGGAWQATVYAPKYEEIPMCEVGSVEFTGLAATEARARALAEAAAETALRKWAGWRERWDRERAERAAARETQ